MLEIELPKGFEDRLAAVAAKRGQTTTSCAREFIMELVEDMEDLDFGLNLLKERKNNPVKLWTTEEVKAQLGLED